MFLPAASRLVEAIRGYCLPVFSACLGRSPAPRSAQLPRNFLFMAMLAATSIGIGLPAVLHSQDHGDKLATLVASGAHGDTIRVVAGIHHGPIAITRRLVLVGDSGAVIDGGGKGTTLTVMADSVVVTGLTIRNSGRSLDNDDAALLVRDCTGCRIEDVVIEQSLHGIYLSGCIQNVLLNNSVTGIGTLQESRRGNGIHLYNSSGNRLRFNSVATTRDGIYFSFASNNRIDSNTVTGVRYGLHYMYSDDNAFFGNRFSRNAAGAAIMFSNRIELRNNEFSDHLGSRAYGALLQTTAEVLVEGNTFTGNLIAIFLDNSNRVMFRNNRITNNGIGIDLLPSSFDNTFAGNSFESNRTPVRIARGSGRSTWSEGGRGNYWGRRASFDLDGDGVGDVPYRVGDAFATLAQSRTALEIYAGTPAAVALSWAEEAFPAFQDLRVVDPSPVVRFTSGASEVNSPVVVSSVAAAFITSLLLASLLYLLRGTSAGRRRVGVNSK